MLKFDEKIHSSGHLLSTLNKEYHPVDQLSNRELLKTYPKWGPEFIVHFELKIANWMNGDDHGAVLLFSSEWGFQVPGVWAGTEAEQELIIHVSGAKWRCNGIRKLY